MNGIPGFPAGCGKQCRARLAGKARHARIRGRRLKAEGRKLRTQDSELRTSDPARLTIPIGSCKSNGIDSDQVPGTFSGLTIPALSPQALAQSEKRFLILFSASPIETVR